MAQIGIVCGSDSDLPKISECFEILEQFKVPFEVAIASAHRTPDQTREWVLGAAARGIAIIIAAAGGAAHLPGVIAAHTVLPVIGIPIETGIAGGIDSLLSIVQMPSGIPVATMAAGKAGAANAALYAVRILALSDSDLAARLETYRSGLAERVVEKNKALQSAGYREYLKKMK